MKKHIPLAVIIITLIAFSCQSPKERALLEIDKLEVQEEDFNIENVAKLKDAYIDFADKYPDDERTPEFLFKAGQNIGAIAAKQNDMQLHKDAISIFERIVANYSKSNFAEEALFMIGFIYENYLNDLDNAKKSYTSFIEKYPNSELVEDARLSIENLGIAPEEIIKKKR